MPLNTRRARALATVLTTESIATARSALWPLAKLHPMPTAPATSLHPPVVLVHGYLGHRAMWRPLMRRMIHQGWSQVERVGYPSTQLSLDQIARRIDEVVRPLAADGPVDLVGHSLGAVACRAYLKVFGGAAHVRHFVALGGPHAGTAIYRLTPPKLWEVLNPDGPWVQRLNATEEPVPTTVVRARYDHQVLPPRRASLHGAREIVLEGYGHNGLLWARKAHEAVIEALRTA